MQFTTTTLIFALQFVALANALPKGSKTKLIKVKPSKSAKAAKAQHTKVPVSHGGGDANTNNKVKNAEKRVYIQPGPGDHPPPPTVPKWTPDQNSGADNIGVSISSSETTTASTAPETNEASVSSANSTTIATSSSSTAPTTLVQSTTSSSVSTTSASNSKTNGANTQGYSSLLIIGSVVVALF